MIITPWILIRGRNMSQTVLQKITKHFTFNKRFFRKRCSSCVNMDECGGAGQTTDDNISRHKRFQCRINKTRIQTHSQHIILTAFQGKYSYTNSPHCYVIRELLILFMTEEILVIQERKPIDVVRWNARNVFSESRYHNLLPNALQYFPNVMCPYFHQCSHNTSHLLQQCMVPIFPADRVQCARTVCIVSPSHCRRVAIVSPILSSVERP